MTNEASAMKDERLGIAFDPSDEWWDALFAQSKQGAAQWLVTNTGELLAWSAEDYTVDEIAEFFGVDVVDKGITYAN